MKRPNQFLAITEPSISAPALWNANVSYVAGDRISTADEDIHMICVDDHTSWGLGSQFKHWMPIPAGALPQMQYLDYKWEAGEQSTVRASIILDETTRELFIPNARMHLKIYEQGFPTLTAMCDYKVPLIRAYATVVKIQGEILCQDLATNSGPMPKRVVDFEVKGEMCFEEKLVRYNSWVIPKFANHRPVSPVA